MNTADNGSYIGGQLTVHYTRNAVGTPYRNVKVLCGQATRRSYFGVHADAQTVTCIKCLAAN